MKNLPSDSGIRKILRDGDFKGSNRSHGRVTVEPYWKLNLTEEGYGDGNRGPYRWYQRADDSQFEVEVPNIKSIEINRDIDQPVASCTIVIYNQWHNLNNELPELASQLGKPGYFWFERGKAGSDLEDRWHHTESTGGKTRDGTAALDDGDPFSWVNVLVPNAMIRTYQGYGGHGTSINACLASNNLTRTGVWIVDTVVAGTDGLLTLSCRDVGRLLMNQRVFPPLVPEYLYPLDYYPDGTVAFDSPWEPPILADGTEAAARGVNPTVFAGSSIGVRDNGDPMNSTPAGVDFNYPPLAKDNRPNTWSWTQATQRPDDNTDWWDFRTTSSGTANTSEITVYPWGGGYVMYVSIDEGAGWVDYADGAVGPLSYHVRPDGSTDSVGGYPYVAVYPIPDADPGKERPLTFDLPRAYDIEKIRITFRHAKLTRNGYRSGLRDLVCVKVVEPLTLDAITTGAEDIICVGIARSGGSGGTSANGYWVLDSSGHTYGFGDAADYDETIFGAATSHCVTQFFGINDYNHYAAMVGHPDGQGYWLLEQNGYVSAFGSAAFMGHNVRWPPGPRLQYFNSLIGDIAMDIAVNSDGTGYWVVYADGEVWGFGAEGGSGALVYNVPITDTAVFATAIMNARTPKFQLYYGTAMVGHPTAAPGTASFWVSNGWGEVFNHGECKSYGGFVNAKSSGNPYGVALDPDEWIWAMDCTGDGGGYWLVGGSGRIAQFGNATGRGETDLYKDFRNQQFPSDPYAEFDPKLLRDVYKGMIRDIIRGHDKPDPDNGGVGGGYYAVTGGGHVIAIRENEWGEPSYWGRSGLRWHQGNYCVDDTTEVFTNRGWIDCYSLTKEDKVLGINPATSLAEWQDVTNIFIKETEVKMYHTVCRGFDSLTTENHKWLVKKNNVDGWRWTTSEDLNTNDRIPIRATLDANAFPAVESYSDDIVRLAAYYWTEGNYETAGRKTARVSLSQSRHANPQNWQDIYDSFQRLWGEPGDMRGGLHKWTTQDVNSGTTSFRLGSDFGNDLTSLVKGVDKIIDQDFIFALTESQVKMFVEESIKADGTIRKDNGTIVISQSNKERLKSFEVACVLAGYGISLTDNGGRGGYYLTLIRLGFKSPVANAKMGHGAIHEVIDYTGTIWCPTTTHHNWLARRNGKTYFTGNTDYTDIVKEMLLWSGFLLYDGTTLDVHGDLEKTGIKSDTHITLDQIDKKTVLEVINMLREIVGYTFFIDDEGAAHLESANFWASGNFITNGSARTHTLDYPDPIDERTNLISYSAMADGSQLVSEIITGNDIPTFQIPQEVHFLRLEMSNAVAPIKTSTEHGTATPLRGIENPALLANPMFKNPNEQRIMAELIALRIWFSQRTGSVKMVCDPTIQINDQVKIIERNTSESYYHYVRSISTSMDLDTGEYTAQLSTNWLGTQEVWTITRDNLTDALRQVKISEKGDVWQTLAANENNRPALETGFIGEGSAESRLDWRFEQDFVVMNRALVGSTLQNNTTWTMRCALEIEGDAAGVGVDDAVVSVELYQPEIMGPVDIVIDSGSVHHVTKNGQEFHTGPLTQGTHYFDLSAGGSGVPKEGNVVFGMKIEAARAGSSFASANVVIHNETALPNPGEEPVGPKCLGIGLTTFWDGTDAGHLITDPYLTWTVTFSEPVIGLTSGDFSVRATGSITYGELGITGSGDTYTVLVVGIAGTGKIGVDLHGGSTIQGWPSGNYMPPLTTIGKPYYRTG